MDVDCRLAVYGSLAPGRENHHVLGGLTGRWLPGTLRGRLLHLGWGLAMGYPALVLDPDGDTVEAALFESVDLLAHWERLDAFEGAEYERVVAPVETSEGVVHAHVYVLRDRPV